MITNDDDNDDDGVDDDDGGDCDDDDCGDDNDDDDCEDDHDDDPDYHHYDDHDDDDEAGAELFARLAVSPLLRFIPFLCSDWTGQQKRQKFSNTFTFLFVFYLYSSCFSALILRGNKKDKTPFSLFQM